MAIFNVTKNILNQFCIKISDKGFHLRMYVLSYRGLVAEKSVKLTIQCKLCVNETNGTIKVPMVKVNPLVFVTGNFGLFFQLQLKNTIHKTPRRHTG